MSLSGQIALVTGASRGVGRGIALQLGAAGATVYITGREPSQSDNKTGTVSGLPTLDKTAEEITSRGGKGIAVYCDHSKLEDIEKLFEQINRDSNGQLDILVNNAYSAVDLLTKTSGKRFWELDPSVWDTVNNVGLRNHYICSVHAARLMVPRRKGIIITVSSAGGLLYFFNVPYGVGKAACDRLAADMAEELKSFGITSVSLWPGAVKTELLMKNCNKPAEKEDGGMNGKRVCQMLAEGETTEFSGLCVVALATDPKVSKKTGLILLTADLGQQYGMNDIDGRSPSNMRSLRTLFGMAGWPKLASWFPGWLKLPGWILIAGTSKM